LGVLLQQEQPELTWYLDGAVTEPSPVRNLTRAYGHYRQPGYTGVMTGVYEFSGLGQGTIHGPCAHHRAINLPRQKVTLRGRDLR
jgi:hypothetical protein